MCAPKNYHNFILTVKGFYLVEMQILGVHHLDDCPSSFSECMFVSLNTDTSKINVDNQSSLSTVSE